MFDQHDIKAAMYGTATQKRFTPELIEGLKLPEFLGKKIYQDVIDTNARGFATLITGDKNYRNNVVTLRLAESIYANCICFIDEIYDIDHFIFDNDFVYVNTKEEISNKILQLKQDKDLYNSIIKMQHDKLKEMQTRDCMKLLLDIIANKL